MFGSYVHQSCYLTDFIPIDKLDKHCSFLRVFEMDATLGNISIMTPYRGKVVSHDCHGYVDIG